MSKIVSINMSDDEIIDGIKSDDDKAVKALYNQHKGYCIRLMNNKYWDYYTNQDIYQDAILIFIKNIKSKDLKIENTSIQSYLNSICINQVKIRLKKENKNNLTSTEEFDHKFIKDKTNITYEENINDLKIKNIDHEENEFISERVNIILEELEVMKEKGPDCFKLLKSIFYENRKLEAIAALLKYKNTRSAITQSYKCRERLKKQVFKRLVK
jgi:DNA-directed RNA polymerase specialized sigma24 family protein